MSDRPNVECSKPALQRQVYRWALTKGRSEPEPQDDELAEHIRSCPSCQQAVVDWKRKALTWELWEDAKRIVSGAIKAGEPVETKTTPSGKAFFRHGTAPDQAGLLILVDEEGQIQSVDATARPAEFEHLAGSSDS